MGLGVKIENPIGFGSRGTMWVFVVVEFILKVNYSKAEAKKNGASKNCHFKFFLPISITQKL